jgi:hypothetical protein
MLKKIHLYQSNRPIEVIRHWISEGYLELNPPYQRGDVWGTKRRVNLIRSMLLGVPIPSVIINDRMRAEFVGDKNLMFSVIDGKQRITTIAMFFFDKLAVPGEWFDEKYLVRKDGGDVVFSSLSVVGQRLFKNLPMAFSEAAIDSLGGEKEVFDLVNYGGIQQGEVDCD